MITINNNLIEVTAANDDIIFDVQKDNVGNVLVTLGSNSHEMVVSVEQAKEIAQAIHICANTILV